MRHYMSLLDRPFSKIMDGTKTIEIRLNDEKRRGISIGDDITFTKVSDEAETLTVQVVDLHPHPSFAALYQAFSFAEFGCEGYTMEQLLSGTYDIYAKENEARYGVLGIRVKRIG